MTHGEEYDDDTVELVDDPQPTWFPGNHLPEDARRLGLTHHVPDGALLDFAGSLDGTKPYHRVRPGSCSSSSGCRSSSP